MTDAAITTDIAPEGFRASLKRFSMAGTIAFLLIFAASLVFMPIAAVLILIWAWLSRSWREIGFVRPRSWIGGLVVGIALGLGLKLLMKAVVLPLLGAPAENPVFHYLVGNFDEAWKFALYAILGAGFAEELFFRGYLFDRFHRIIGKGAVQTVAIVIVTTVLFGIAHWAQSWAGMVNAAVGGLSAALVYLACGRKLWVPVAMHSTFDLSAAVMIYYGAESQVAHLVFK